MSLHECLPTPGCLNLQEASRAEAKPKEEQVAVAAEDVNLEETRHQGQVALRRLYHESKRPLVVMYTSPGCGAPCPVEDVRWPQAPEWSSGLKSHSR